MFHSTQLNDSLQDLKLPSACPFIGWIQINFNSSEIPPLLRQSFKIYAIVYFSVVTLTGVAMGLLQFI